MTPFELACIRVNRVMLINLCTETIKLVLEGDENLTAVERTNLLCIWSIYRFFCISWVLITIAVRSGGLVVYPRMLLLLELVLEFESHVGRIHNFFCKNKTKGSTAESAFQLG